MDTLSVRITDSPRFTRRQKLHASSRQLPKTPGVYIMQDSCGRTIYVGKAVNLRRRVASYVTDSGMQDHKVSRLVSEFHSLLYIETHSELEALLVESRLIKERRPIFNRRLIDPDSCCFLGLDFAEDTPRIDVAYSVPGTGRYVGPFWKSSLVRDACEAVADVYRLRRCSGSLEYGSRKRTCIYFELDKCSGPCIEAIPRDEYCSRLEAAWDDIIGYSGYGVGELIRRRDHLAEELRFEEAHRVQEQIRALEHVARFNASSFPAVGRFAVVAPSYMPRHPVVLLFCEGHLAWKTLASSRTYPDEGMLCRRIMRLGSGHIDLLPGRPSSDDLLIISSYLRGHGLESSYLPIDEDAVHAAQGIVGRIRGD